MSKTKFHISPAKPVPKSVLKESCESYQAPAKKSAKEKILEKKLEKIATEYIEKKKATPKPINQFTVTADIYEVRPDKPLPPKTKEPNYKVFLGGGITKCPNWQKKVIEHAEKNWQIPTVIWNPRCEVFNVKDPKASDKQVAWEYERLRKADTITFWFDKATLCPIVLFELGSALWRSLGKGTELVIGCDPKYERLFDVQKQVALFNKTNKTKHKVLVGFDNFLKAL